MLKRWHKKENIYSRIIHISSVSLHVVLANEIVSIHTDVELRLPSLYPSQCGTHATEHVSLLSGDSVRVVFQNTVQMIVVSLEPSLLLVRRFLPLLNWRLQELITRHIWLRTDETRDLWLWKTFWIHYSARRHFYNCSLDSSLQSSFRYSNS